MQIAEYELKRYELWKEDFKQKKNDRQPQDYEKSVKKLRLLVKKQDQLLRGKGTLCALIFLTAFLFQFCIIFSTIWLKTFRRKRRW